MTGSWKDATLMPAFLTYAADLQLRSQALTEPEPACSPVQQHLLAMVSAAMSGRSFCPVESGVSSTFAHRSSCTQDPAGTTQVGLCAAVRQPLRIKADCAPGLKDDEALFLISQSSQAKINPSQTKQEPETISRRTLSQQAEALIPYLTAQHYLPYA